MNLDAAQLKGHLQKPLRPLYTVVGDEILLVQEALDALRAHGKTQGYTERHAFTVQGVHFDWSAVQAACDAMSLFADRQVVEVHLPSGKPGKEGGQALQQLAERAAQDDNTLLLVVLPKLDKTARQTDWFLALERHGVCIAVEAVLPNAMPTWIAERMAKAGQRLPSGAVGQEAMRFFVERVEGNLLAAHQEVLKLALLYPPGEITFEQLERAVLDVARYDVFALGAAVWSGQVARVVKMLDGLKAEGVAAVLVHYTLAEDVRVLARLKTETSRGKPLPMALRENRVWGAKEKQFEAALPRLSLAQIQQWLQDAHTVDGLVKGLHAQSWPIDPWLALAQWATDMTLALRRVASPVVGKAYAKISP